MTRDFSLSSDIQTDPETGKVLYRWKPELKELNGILQPVEVEEISTAGKELTKISFIKSFINVPIPERNFTLHFLGVRQEDMVYDNRTQSRSRVTDTSFPEALYKPQQTRPEENRQIWRYVFMATGAIFILIVLMIKYLRWRARRSGGTR